MINNRKLSWILPVIIALVLISASCSRKKNWPQFRGPEGNMTVTSSGLPEKWGNDTNILWTAALDGPGYSSPVIWKNKVFITYTFPEKVNPVPERGPMQGPPPQGGQGPQGAQGQPVQPGKGPVRDRDHNQDNLGRGLSRVSKVRDLSLCRDHRHRIYLIPAIKRKYTGGRLSVLI
jgi:hypothetical protein